MGRAVLIAGLAVIAALALGLSQVRGRGDMSRIDDPDAIRAVAGRLLDTPLPAGLTPDDMRLMDREARLLRLRFRAGTQDVDRFLAALPQIAPHDTWTPAPGLFATPQDAPRNTWRTRYFTMDGPDGNLIWLVAQPLEGDRTALDILVYDRSFGRVMTATDDRAPDVDLAALIRAPDGR